MGEAPTGLPSGTITFLLSDIERSTALWEEHGEGMGRSVERHEEIVVSAVEAAGGILLRSKGEGDSCFCVFTSASAAVRAALDTQVAMVRERWSGPPIKVRIAILTGTAEVRDGQYYGTAVNRCARLRGIGHGGQTLLSSTSAGLVRDSMPGGASLKDLGSHRLKDLAQPERVYQLCHPDLLDLHPALTSLDAYPNNLPVQLTRFVGRESELAELTELLSEQRMITLTGPGGSGKTRLALQAAAASLDPFADGVWLVSLSAVSDPAFVVSQIAVTLGLREEAGRALIDSVGDYLAHRTVLIVLDNCEHLVGEAANVVATLLNRCPSVAFIATSRRALGVEGEVARPLDPLTIPAVTDRPEQRDELMSYGAVQLLEDRARLARPGFEVTDDNAAAVARICRQLDGIPLAIEFVAARLGSLGPAELARRLDDRFRLLSQGRRTGPQRQQTLEATINWSYELLADDERLLFRRLAVFAGRFVLEGAEAVCSDEALARDDISELLSHLVDGSLVFADTRGEVTGYRMLSTIRGFALSRLESSDELQAMCARHLRWCLDLAHAAESELYGSDQARWFDVLAEVHDDARAALTWSLAADPGASMTLAARLSAFWDTRGYWSEGRRWLDLAIAAATEDSLDLARVLRAGGNFAHTQGDAAEAMERLERALAIFRSLGDEEGEILTLSVLGSARGAAGDRDGSRACFDEGLALIRGHANDRRKVGMLMNLAMSAQTRDDPATADLYAEALALSREQGHTRGIAGALLGLGTLAQTAGDVRGVRASCEEALVLFRRLGDKSGTAAALSSLAMAARDLGELDGAYDLLSEALPLQRELGNRRGEATTLSRLGTVAWSRDDHAAAAKFHTDALTSFRRLGDTGGTAYSLISLARVARSTGDTSSAGVWLGEALGLCGRVPAQRMTATCLEESAGLCITSDPERAARMFGAAEVIRKASGSRGHRTAQASYDRDITELRRRLDASDLDAAWAQGAVMGADEAIAYARGIPVAS